MHALHPEALGAPVIASASNRLADLFGSADPTTRVPTCGGWTLADLVWHVTEVQTFWTDVVAKRPASPDDHVAPTRPGTADLAEALRASAAGLVAALRGADPQEPAWSWSDDRTVGFALRRQTHEALVHTIDGHLAVGADLPEVTAELAADGVDELLRVMVGGVPPWATFTAGEETIAVRATDTGDAWRVRVGRMTGTSPTTGTAHDLSAYEVEATTNDPADTTLVGTALALDLWCWGRGDLAPLELTGRRQLVDDLRTAISESTQ